MTSKEHESKNEALEKTSSIFAKTITLANDAVFLIDKKGKITLWNAAAEKMFGYTSAEMIGKEVENFLSDNAGKNNSIKNIGILSGELKDKIVPFSFTKKNGLKIFVEASFSVIEGIHEYYMMVIIRDISHLMKIEEELHNEKMKFITAFENAPFGIILINKNGKFEYINKKFQELFGYSLDELPDWKTWFRKVFPDPKYRHEIMLTWLNNAIDEESGKKNSWILTITCKDKTEKIVNFIPVKIVNGEFVVSCEDMTELKKSEHKLLRFANYDMLTGLPNRHSLELALRITIDKAKKSERRGNLSALLFLDIDDFKEINHSFGHNTGDEVLIAVGKLLSKSLRTGDSAFRFEGDEFAILFRGISMAEARLAAERLQNIINQHNFIFDYTKSNLTIGIGLIQINGKMDIATLLSLVVRTTHKAKALGKNYIAVY
ncbi:MAG: diguanylate cyclase [Proteobacteria bacterium]|nr:diguanylate cyclase [Pseudomonadota bacterium]